MMPGKSNLNPNAAPYVPLWKHSTAVGLEKTLDSDSVREAPEGSAEHKLPDSVSVDYGIPSFDELHISGESSSYTSQQYYLEDTFDDDLLEFEEQNMMADSSVMLESLSSMFPYIAVECLAELLDANHGDMNETINVLQQLEYAEGDDKAEYPFDTTKTSGISDPASLKATASGMDSST